MTITVISFDIKIKDLPRYIVNIGEFSQEFNDLINICDYFIIRNSHSLLFYKRRQCVIDCMITGTFDNKHAIVNAYTKNGLIFESEHTYKRYVILNKRQEGVKPENEDRIEYWSRVLGWVAQDDASELATVYTHKQKEDKLLPIGGEWYELFY